MENGLASRAMKYIVLLELLWYFHCSCWGRKVEALYFRPTEVWLVVVWGMFSRVCLTRLVVTNVLMVAPQWFTWPNIHYKFITNFNTTDLFILACECAHDCVIIALSAVRITSSICIHWIGSGLEKCESYKPVSGTCWVHCKPSGSRFLATDQYMFNTNPFSLSTKL